MGGWWMEYSRKISKKKWDTEVGNASDSVLWKCGP